MIRIDRAYRALIWKEFRQLLPLVYMLVGVTLTLLVMGGLISPFVPGAYVSSATILLTMPAFFAAGAGAILIGQERESETMQWVSTLPVTATQTFFTKLLVAAIGLAAMWTVAAPVLLLSNVMHSQFSRSVFPDPFIRSLAVWIVHSIYLMFCGIYSSWRCKNVFSGLMLSLALACIPYILGIISADIYAAFTRGYATDSVRLAFSGMWSIVGIVAMTLLALRAAKRVLAPSNPPTISLSASQQASPSLNVQLDQYCPPKADGPPPRPFQFSISALIWQKAKHNRGKLALLGLLVFAGVGSFPLNSAPVAGRFLPGMLMFNSVIGLLAVSWLGVVAFIGDGSSPAMRFLADRGVSPTRAWWGRHLIAFAIMASSILIYILVQRLVAAGALRTGDLGASSIPMLSAITILGILLAVYSLSQWTSQVLRVLAGTAFLAPLIAGVVLTWLNTCWSDIGTPFWLMMAIVTLPLIATWTQMRRHMDGPRGWGFFAVHGLTFAAIFSLPLLWCWQEISSYPEITAQRRAELLASAKQVSSPTAAAVSIHRRKTPYESLEGPWATGIPTSDVINALQAVGQTPDDWLEIDGDVNVPLQGDFYFVSRALPTTQAMQMRWLQSLENHEQETEQAKEDFLAWIRSMTQIAKRLRLNWMLRDHGHADRIEMALTRMLVHPSTRLLREEKAIQEAVAMLADQAARSESRRRAVLLSWDKYISNQEIRNRHGLGGYDVLDYLSDKPAVQQWYLKFSTADLICSELVDLINAGQAGDSTLAHRQKLESLTKSYPGSVLPSPYSDRMQSTLYADQLSGYWQTPGCYWYAEWEEAAKSISAQMQPSKKNHRGPQDES
jgi:hypothetical protein